MTLYSVNDASARLHYRRDVQTFVHIEISNTANTSGGFFEKYVSLETRISLNERNFFARYDEEGPEDDDMAIGVDVQANDDGDDEEEDEVNELGDGMYLRSGDPVVLCVANDVAIQKNA